MSQQLPLFADRPSSGLVCAFGVDWIRHHVEAHDCPACAAATEQLRREFAEGVAAGQWDREGYTPSDRRAQRKKAGLHA